MLDSDAEAEEVVQEAYLTAFTRLSEFRSEARGNEAETEKDQTVSGSATSTCPPAASPCSWGARATSWRAERWR